MQKQKQKRKQRKRIGTIRTQHKKENTYKTLFIQGRKILIHTSKSDFKNINSNFVARVMAHQLRELAVLREDIGFVPITHMEAYNHM